MSSNVKLDLTGQIYDDLTVLWEADKRRYPSKVDWICQCKCGEITRRTTQQLRRNQRSSCKSCISKRNIKKTLENNGGHPTNYNPDRVDAAVRKKAFSIMSHTRHELLLNYEQIYAIIKQPCHYCGTVNTKELTNGIDRIDSTKIYTLDNIVPCCWICNKMKSTLTVDEFYEHIKQILKHYDESLSS